MDMEEKSLNPSNSSWEPISESFLSWLEKKEKILGPGLTPEPTIKVLVFLALLESDTASTYRDIRKIFKIKNVIKGIIPDNTLRTSILNLGKTLQKFEHPLELKALRGRFQLIPRIKKIKTNISSVEQNVLLIDTPIINEKDIARAFIEKSMLPFNALYFLEWSARCWENYSRQEAEIRAPYESDALVHLKIKDRLSKYESPILSIISLGPSEGLAEIEILKKFYKLDKTKKIHYLAVDSSPRLLRNHIGLLKEIFIDEIKSGHLICSGIVSDIFSNLQVTIQQARFEFIKIGTIQNENDFLPSSSPLFITYLGNCLGNDGNNSQDPEINFFSMIHSVFSNRPLEILVGVSVMRSEPDEYKRNWDDFLLQTPKYFLKYMNLFESTKEKNCLELDEFEISNSRCLPVIPEKYVGRHKIEGQIYRFYYKLGFDLKLANIHEEIRQLPKDALILLYNIIKYNIQTLVSGIEKTGLFKINYNPNYHLIVNTNNGVREYAVFSAFLE